MFINMPNTSSDLGPVLKSVVLHEANMKWFNRGLNKGRLTALRGFVVVVDSCFVLFFIIFYLTTLEYHNEIFNHMNISH